MSNQHLTGDGVVPQLGQNCYVWSADAFDGDCGGQMFDDWDGPDIVACGIMRLRLEGEAEEVAWATLRGADDGSEFEARVAHLFVSRAACLAAHVPGGSK